MLAYLQKPAVQITLFALAIAGAGAFFYFNGEQRIGGQPAKPPPPGMGASSPEKTDVQRKDLKVTETTETNKLDKLVLPPLKPEAPIVVKEKEKPREEPKKKSPQFPSLVQVKARQGLKPFEPTTPEIFAPRGTLIKAALVITLESNSVGTPVLGMVTEDVYFQGHLIVPAGTQVQSQSFVATGAQDSKENNAPKDGKVRDRIEVRGPWRFVWADGTEYVINGMALDYEPLPDGTYSILDGSPGIRGRILKTDDYAEMKILISEALQGYAKNQQSTFNSIYGVTAENSPQNSALGGGISGAAAYSNILSKKLAQDLEYVQVPAGTQFYIYTSDVFEPELRSIGGLKQGNMPRSGLDLQQASYNNVATQFANETANQVEQIKQEIENSRLLDAAGQREAQSALFDRAKALLSPTTPSQGGGNLINRNLSTPTPAYPQQQGRR